MLQAIFCWRWWPSGRFLRYGIFCATAPVAAVGKNPAENHAAAAVSTAINNDDYFTQSGDVEVTMKGNDGGVSLAVWQDGNNAYSIGIYNAAGITAEEMVQMVSEMME